MLACSFAKSQVIDYAFESLSTCNIFSNATTKDNFTHRTSISRPKYSDNSVVLECKPVNGTSILSTIYSIAYNFKVGYNYQIQVYYKGEKRGSDGLYPSVGLSISTTNGGNDNNSTCVSPTSYSLASANAFSQGASGPTYGYANLINQTMT